MRIDVRLVERCSSWPERADYVLHRFGESTGPRGVACEKGIFPTKGTAQIRVKTLAKRVPKADDGRGFGTLITERV